jgi:hypothetical protein
MLDNVLTQTVALHAAQVLERQAVESDAWPWLLVCCVHTTAQMQDPGVSLSETAHQHLHVLYGRCEGA